MDERDPTGLSSHEPGAKLDDGKPPTTQGLLHYFPRALKAVADLSLVGAEQYSWRGWEKVSDGVNRYGNAASRHQLDEAIDGLYDPKTKVLHATASAWNLLARLELILREGTPPRDPQE